MKIAALRMSGANLHFIVFLQYLIMRLPAISDGFDQYQIVCIPCERHGKQERVVGIVRFNVRRKAIQQDCALEIIDHRADAISDYSPTAPLCQ